MLRIASVLVVCGLAVLAVAAIVKVRRAAQTSLDGSTYLHQTIVTALVVDEFVAASDPPAWPTSWDDLASITVDYGWIQWPQDADAIRAAVEIDFETTLEAVAATDPDDFTVIRPRVEVYEGTSWYISFVIETARARLRQE
jgi:hypothetical protein